MHRGIMRLGCQNERGYGLAQGGTSSGLSNALFRELSTSFLVIRCMGVVNRVMKPDGQFHCDRLPGQMPREIKLRKALGNMAEIMVMPMRLGAQCNQFHRHY